MVPSHPNLSVILRFLQFCEANLETAAMVAVQQERGQQTPACSPASLPPMPSSPWPQLVRSLPAPYGPASVLFRLAQTGGQRPSARGSPACGNSAANTRKRSFRRCNKTPRQTQTRRNNETCRLKQGVRGRKRRFWFGTVKIITADCFKRAFHLAN